MVIVEGLESKDKLRVKLEELIRKWWKYIDLEILWILLFEMDLMV